MSVRVFVRHPVGKVLSLGGLLAFAYGLSARAQPAPEPPSIDEEVEEEDGSYEMAEATPGSGVAPASTSQSTATPAEQDPSERPGPVQEAAPLEERPVQAPGNTGTAQRTPGHGISKLRRKAAAIVPGVQTTPTPGGVIVEPQPTTHLANLPANSPPLRPEEVTRRQAEYLQQRFDLAGRTHATIKMSGGKKPIPVGPTARLPAGVTWDQLARMTPNEIKQKKVFPYTPLWHPLQDEGGMVFPPVETAQVTGLERNDVLYDLPDTYLPEFPPPLYITSRPDLGDVSQGQLITLQNADVLFHDILTPTQLDGLKLMLQRTPAQLHNLTEERATAHPVPGVACMDCHVNGHTTAQFELTPDLRPQSERFRVDTASLRGSYVQSWFGSKRALRSLEQFILSEEVGAYFDGDGEAAERKGGRRLSQEEIASVAQFTRLIDFPPAPKLNSQGLLERTKASPGELRGEKLFNQHCASCHARPWFTDNLAHDLKVERFYDHLGSSSTGAPGRAEGAMKTPTLRGLKDSPPYLHDGRLLTLEDAVEFFNLVLSTKLNKQQRADLVEYLRTL